MQSILRPLLCAIPALAAWQAQSAPINIVSYTSGSSPTTSTATAGCTSGQVAVIIAATDTDGTPSGITDNVGGTYTVSPARFEVASGDYVQAIVAKRLVTSGTQITTSTTFTLTFDAGVTGDLVVEGYCVADGTGIPTANDASSTADPVDMSVPAPTAPTSYQFAAVIAYGADPTLNSSAPWTLANHALGPNGRSGLLVAWRQTGGASSLDWNGQISGFNGVGFSEIATSAATSGPSPSAMTLMGVQ